MRITATGVRNSCDASETRRRFVVDAVSRRPSIWFIVRASSAISSDDGGSGTRSCSERDSIAATRASQLHRPQRPAGEQPRQPGDERHERRADDHSSRVVVRSVSRTSSSGDAVASIAPPIGSDDTV